MIVSIIFGVYYLSRLVLQLGILQMMKGIISYPLIPEKNNNIVFIECMRFFHEIKTIF